MATIRACAVLLLAAMLVMRAAGQPPIVSSTIYVGTPSKVLRVVSDCDTLWGTIGVTLSSLTSYQFLNYTCAVPTGTGLPSILTLTLNYNGTLGNPWAGLTNNAAYLRVIGFQSFLGAIGPMCQAEALLNDTLNGAFPGQIISGCTADRTVQSILRPGYGCNQTLSLGSCTNPSPPPSVGSPSPPPPPFVVPSGNCLVIISAQRPAGSGFIFDQNCQQIISLTAPWFTAANTSNTNNYCLDTGAYSSTISYAATVGSASYSLLAQSFLANTITANVLINQIPLTCGGTITLTSNCAPAYLIITQATVPLAYSSPRACVPFYPGGTTGRKALAAH